MRNNGKPSENLVISIAAAYEAKGIMRLRKVDPPSVWVAGRMTPTENPFPDFVGSWTARGGRMLACEVKSTTEPKLLLGGGGITDKQSALLTQWQASGAVTFVLWLHDGKMALIPWPWVTRREPGSPRHLKWMQPNLMVQTRPGMGMILHDFEKVLELIWQ